MTIALSSMHNDAAFFRKRKAMLVLPWIVLPFIFALFWVLGGGKGERYQSRETAADKPGASGFNASVPNAKTGKINGRDVEGPVYGKAAAGQVLSSFTNTRQDSTRSGLKPLLVRNAPAVSHASSLAKDNGPVSELPSDNQVTTVKTKRDRSAARKSISTKGEGGYYYQAPGYARSGSDQQVASQLRTYQEARYAASMPTAAPSIPPIDETVPASRATESGPLASIQLSDHLTATRLAEPSNPAEAFNTAPTSGYRRQAERAVLSGGSSYGSKKTVAWMIPVVVHEDQTFKSGNTVKLRLTREILADGITVPTNTILHAVCQSGEDRLRMVVHSLQLNGQLIPLDLEVYDMDGLAGVNMPGLSNQVSPQLQSSAIQGLQVPIAGSLINTMASTARMQAAQNLRQPTVRLRAGYNLYLKAQ